MATEVKATAKGDLNIWKLSLLYSLSRAVHRVVQRKRFTFVFRVQSLSGDAVSWQYKVHREMDLFRDAQEKTAMDNLQSARTHNFLTVNFPWKNISPSYLWTESLQLPTRQGRTSSHSEPSPKLRRPRKKRRALKGHEWITGHLATREFRHLPTRHQETTSPPTNSKSTRHQTPE